MSYMSLESRAAIAQGVAERAKAKGFGYVTFELRDSYSGKTVRGDKLHELLAPYLPNEKPSIEVLVSFGRSKVPVREI
jgi:hypothetical protein